AEHEGDALGGAEVGQPVPGEHTFAGDDQAVAVGGDGLEEVVRPGGDLTVEGDVAVGIEDAQSQGPGMEIDAAVESVLGGVEAHGEASAVWVRRPEPASWLAGASCPKIPRGDKVRLDPLNPCDRRRPIPRRP